MARLGRSQPTNVIYSDDIFSLPIITTGTGAAAATGTGILITSLGGHGDGTSTPTAALNLAARVAGNGVATSSGTGLLIETARLAGTGTAAAGVQAPLEIVGGHVDLGGHGDSSDGSTLDLLLAVDLSGHGDASATGTAAPLLVPPVVGYLAWYDATDPATIIVSFGVVAAWGDKSGNGYDLGAASIATAPSTGVRTICHNNVISFSQIPNDQGLVFAGLPLFDNTISVFVVAEFESGNRLLSLTDGTQSDWDNTAGLAVLDLVDDGSFYDNAFVTGGDGAAFADGRAFVYDVIRAGPIWTANRDGVPFLGALTEDDNFNATDIGVGGIPSPPDVAAGATGLVGEILVYDAALTTDQVTAVEAYLISKWLLRNAALLSGHGDAASTGATGLFGNAAVLTGHGDASSATTAGLSVRGLVDLAGQGTASTTGKGSAQIAASLTGHGDAATTGTGIQIAQLIGHGDATAASVIDVIVRNLLLAGHGDATSTGTFDLLVRPQVDLTGHGDTAATGTAVLRLTVALVGTGTAASAVSALVRLTLALTGHGDGAAVASTTTLFGAVQDPDAGTLTVLDDGHMGTIWDRDHTVTLVDTP